MSRLAQDGTAERVSRDQILRRERGQRNIDFPCSADLEQDYYQPYPVDPYSAICDDHTSTTPGLPGVFEVVEFLYFSIMFSTKLNAV